MLKTLAELLALAAFVVAVVALADGIAHASTFTFKVI